MCFSFLKTFQLSCKRLLQFWLTGGELQFSNSVWECPYRVIKDMRELWVSESLGALLGCWLNQPSCGLLGLAEPKCEWLLSCLGRELGTAVQYCRGVISNGFGHLLCSATIIPVWHRWILLTPLSNNLSSPANMFTCFFSFRCKWTAAGFIEQHKLYYFVLLS